MAMEAAGDEGSLQTEKSAVTGDNSREFFGSELLGLAAEPAPSEWTDEKHSMYLSFIEASFANQLYNHECSSVDSLGWPPVTQQELLNNNLVQSHPSNHLSSGQFKVLRCGSWQKLKFETGQSSLHCGSEPRHLLKNPWIRHFRHFSTGQQPELLMPGLQVDVSSIRDGTSLAGHSQRSASLEAEITSLQPSISCQISVGQNTEVSDQNFVDGSCSCIEDQLTSSYRSKRVRTSNAIFNSKYQVVPSMDSAPRDDIASQRQDSTSCKRRQL